MLRAIRHPGTWSCALLAWAGVLFFLSSLHGGSDLPPIEHLDKLLHFTYFAAGGFLIAGLLARILPAQVRWKRIVATTLLAIAVIGALDEWHQTFTPGRSGADAADWLADLIGGLAGALLLKAVHPRLK